MLAFKPYVVGLRPASTLSFLHVDVHVKYSQITGRGGAGIQKLQQYGLQDQQGERSGLPGTPSPSPQIL